MWLSQCTLKYSRPINLEHLSYATKYPESIDHCSIWHVEKHLRKKLKHFLNIV